MVKESALFYFQKGDPVKFKKHKAKFTVLWDKNFAKEPFYSDSIFRSFFV